MDKDLLMLCITYYSGLEILLIQSSQVLGKFVSLLIPDSYNRESIRYSLQIRKITEWKELSIWKLLAEWRVTGTVIPRKL